MNPQAHTDVPTVLGEGNLPREGRDREARSDPSHRWGWGIAWFTVVLGAGLLTLSVSGWINGMQTQNDRLRSAVDSLAIERADLHEQTGFLESVRHMLIGKLETSEQGRAAAESLVRTLGEEKAALGEQVEKLTGAVDILMEKLTSSKVRLASLEQATRAKDGRIGELEGTRDRLLVANFDLKHEIAAARSEIDALHGANEALAEEVAAIARREENLLAELQRVSTENAAVATENYRLQTRLARLTHDLANKEAAVTALQEHLARLEVQAQIALADEPVGSVPFTPSAVGDDRNGEAAAGRTPRLPRVLD